MKTIPVFLAVLFSSLCFSIAEAQKSKINALTEETQLMSNDDDKMRLVWWIPNEFWLTAFEDEESMSPEKVEQFIALFDDFSVFAVADGDISAFGSVTYQPKEAVLNSTYIFKDGKEHQPLTEDEVNADVKIVLGMLKPVLSNMLGNMGENIHFILFKGYTNKNKRFIEPLEDDDFLVFVGGEKFEYNLPIGALMPSKTCPNHAEEMRGSWNFCPFCGSQLVLIK